MLTWYAGTQTNLEHSVVQKMDHYIKTHLRNQRGKNYFIFGFGFNLFIYIGFRFETAFINKQILSQVT